MTAEAGTAVVRTFLEALWAGDKAAAKAQFADESEWWFRPSLGYQRPMPGPEAIDVVSDDMIGRFDPAKPFNVEVHHLFGEGGEVAAEYTATGTTVSGREYRHRYLLRASVSDGKITTVRPWVDTKYFLDTLYGE
ncbi:MAG: nuclear transport factor 2 family protein [Pseudomonadota bacterium]